MKILIDARFYGLENAGIGRYSMNLVSELCKIDSKNEYILLLRKKYFDSLELPSNWKKVLADIDHYSFEEQIKLPKLIKAQKPDLVHFLHFNVPVFYKDKYVVTIHDLLMHSQKGFEATTLPAPVYLVKRVGYRTVFDAAVRNSKKIIVPSNTIKIELSDFYNLDAKKVSVTYEGFDVKIGSGKMKIVKPYFFYAGNAYPHKNLINLIKAVKLLNIKYNQSVNLAISSSRNIFTQRLEKTIKSLEAEKYVKLLGFVPDDKLGYLYKNSEAFVFPSLSEGFGLPGLEAISAGTLLIASDIKVFKEVYGNAALYFDPNDIGSMAEVIQKALNMSKSEKEKRIKSAQKFVKRYSWAKMARETLEIYKKEGSLSI
ncbi:MAG: glycosyltransferase family 1 protein [Patescibacteria group bacterium]